VAARLALCGTQDKITSPLARTISRVKWLAGLISGVQYTNEIVCAGFLANEVYPEVSLISGCSAVYR